MASPRQRKIKKTKAKHSPKRAPRPQTNGNEEFDLYQEPIKKIIIPLDQLKLTETELKEDIGKILTSMDPNASMNISRYNYKDKMYKISSQETSEHIAVHINIESNLLKKGSEEAKNVESDRKNKRQSSEEFKQDDNPSNDSNAEGMLVEKNQFNYSERTAQCIYNHTKNRGISTAPTPMKTFSGTVSQWRIYDAYISQAKTESFKESAGPLLESDQLVQTVKMLERMASQNAGDELYQDFKYWEDTSDKYKKNEGTLLPLWNFTLEKIKKHVTAISWNPRYSDLFAVSYGSYDFMKQSTGNVALFTLKNADYPESMAVTDAGAMCLDFHPSHPRLLSAGFYDGNVMVFDAKNRVKEGRGNEMKALYKSSIETGKHCDPVWQVCWQNDESCLEPNFFSISSEGKILNWVMSKNELKMEPFLQLKLVGNIQDEIQMSLNGLAGGCCFAFNNHCNQLFLVGTEEGKIHKCSKAYTGQYLQTYEGSNCMAIYALKWSPFHPRAFLSCSADWTVKLWDHTQSLPIMSFDMGTQVGDICWSTYASTVFAVATAQGKVHVFDLAQNKHRAICDQKVTKKSKLTHLSFNSKDPILLVGDDRGVVESFKLSPNLRKDYFESEILSTAEERNAAQVELMEKIIQGIEITKIGS